MNRHYSHQKLNIRAKRRSFMLRCQDDVNDVRLLYLNWHLVGFDVCGYVSWKEQKNYGFVPSKMRMLFDLPRCF